MKTFKILEEHHRNRGSWTDVYILTAEDEEQAKQICREELKYPHEKDSRPYGSDYFSIEEIDTTKPYLTHTWE